MCLGSFWPLTSTWYYLILCQFYAIGASRKKKLLLLVLIYFINFSFLQIVLYTSLSTDDPNEVLIANQVCIYGWLVFLIVVEPFLSTLESIENIFVGMKFWNTILIYFHQWFLLFLNIICFIRWFENVLFKEISFTLSHRF